MGKTTKETGERPTQAKEEGGWVNISGSREAAFEAAADEFREQLASMADDRNARYGDVTVGALTAIRDTINKLLARNKG